MIYNDTYILFWIWFSIEIIFSFLGQATVGFFVFSWLKNKYFPSATQIEIEYLSTMVKESRQELSQAKEDAERLRIDQQKLIEAIISRLQK